MRGETKPSSLYILCLDYCISRMERGSVYSKNWNIVDRLGGSVTEDLLSRAFHLANKDNPSVSKKWRDEWRIFYSSRMSSAILSWDGNLIEYVRKRCKSLKSIEVAHVKTIDMGLVPRCPETIVTLDFDGELINRGKLRSLWVLGQLTTSSWLCDSEKVLRALLVYNMKIPDYTPAPGMPSLCELNLGNMTATAEELCIVLQKCKNLRLLKHYQLVSALYKLHSEAWRKKEPLPVYKLKNLDVDFSHVVRCRMSPEWVLAPNALHLAVKLCPEAKSIRVRFDCSTPNDVLTPLLQLDTLKEFSAVCVSSGERSLIDFSDMAPIFEKNGPKCLTYLELKVIEEVEIHTIVGNCTKLDTLILSGCGYVTPPTCGSYNCNDFGPGSLKKLRLLFYADGDDFSWDHGVPECFWRATLLPSGTNEIVRLQGIFMEYPRIPRNLTTTIFSPGRQRLPFPQLVAVSFCRYDEITVEDVASICGLSTSNPCETLKYVRLSECEKINEAEGKRLKKWQKLSSLDQLRIIVDR